MFDWFRRTLRRISLRSKLVAMMAGLMMVGIAATAWGTAQTTQAALMERVDRDLASSLGELQTGLEVALRVGSDRVTGTSPNALTFFGQLSDADGEVVLTKGVGTVDQPALPPITPELVNEHGRRPFTVAGTDPASRGWRVKAVMRTDGPGTMVIAWPLRDTVRTVEQATASILVAGTLATMVMSLVGYVITTRAFKPLSDVERTAAKIAGGDLSSRVPKYPMETEVGSLSESLNVMLSRIESAFKAQQVSEEKMRRFIQDASHELRTPLVTIRGYSELYRHGGIPDGEPLDQAMGRIESEAKRMTQLVEDLLTLARLDEERPLESQEVDLLILAHDAVADARVSAPDRKISLVGLDGAPPVSAPTRGDEAKLRQVLVNLMTNAMRYTPEGSPIEVAVGSRPVIEGRDTVVLAIVDHGPGIKPEDAKRIFERFYRGDESRDRETGGTGLGLAIVAAIAKQHDGSVVISDTPGGGATLELRLPRIEFSEMEDSYAEESHEDEIPDIDEVSDADAVSDDDVVPDSDGPSALPSYPPPPPEK